MKDALLLLRMKKQCISCAVIKWISTRQAVANFSFRKRNLMVSGGSLQNCPQISTPVILKRHGSWRMEKRLFFHPIKLEHLKAEWTSMFLNFRMESGQNRKRLIL